MKLLFIPIALFFTLNSYAQTNEEKQVLGLSAQIFGWEVENKVDSLEAIFHDKFFVTGSDGTSQNKPQYIARLRSGDFVHNKITVEDNTVTISGNTALVSGKGTFDVTVSGKPVSLHLSYLEVFTRGEINKRWKVLAMKANVLPE
jgi:hypothetical protein